MTTSQTPFMSNLLGKVRPVAFVLGYLRSDFATRLHQGLLSIFLDLESKREINKAELARRINKGPDQITRWLSGPGNLTLDTVSDLAAGMGCRPEIQFVKINEPVRIHSIADTREASPPQNTILGSARDGSEVVRRESLPSIKGTTNVEDQSVNQPMAPIAQRKVA